MSATRVRTSTPAAAAAEDPLSPRRSFAVTTFALAGGAALILGANLWGRHLQAGGVRLWLNAPPLAGSLTPRLPTGALEGATLGVFAIASVWWGPRLVERAGRRTLPWLVFAAAAIWAVLLAGTDGSAGLTGPPAAPGDYLHDAAKIASPLLFLQKFVSNIGAHTTHVRAHPPGMVLLLWGFARAGLSGPPPVAALEILGGAAAVPAVYLAVRELVGEGRARTAAPFLVLAPFAVFFGSGDALFLGVSAWAFELLILATGRGGRRATVLALGGGVLAAAGLFLSYGLLPLLLLPVAVAVARRRTKVLAIATAPIVITGAAFAAAGFVWWQGLAATRVQYAESIARFRPGSYFLVANLAALAIAVGPVTWVGLTRLRDRRLWLMAGAALAAVVLADLSGLSKGEVERIWLPFMPWLVAGAACGLLGLRATPRRARLWLAVQVAWAIGLQLLVRSPW